ncbi:MAG: hypothetical protein KIT46_02180 [Anaerolineales bacterium]|nr:hypothetical protein [Anaerolineales bacterium]MCW5854833.1 hypothetical protein [Anaerolineales bacterium]
MTFNRPPRVQKTIEKEKVKIPSPENLPSKPTINWLTVGLPIVGVGLAIVVMIWVSGGAGGGLSYVTFLPFILASVVASVFTYSSQVKQYEKSVAEASEFYSAELKDTRKELIRITQAQTEVLQYNNPDLAACFELAESSAYRLGERRPEDADFLSLRIGAGSLPSEIEFEGPTLTDRKNELIRMVKVGEQLKKDFSELTNVPVAVSLREVGNVGISGKRSECLEVAQAMLVQLATHHWPGECNFLVYCNSALKVDWRFAEILPHKSHLLPTPVNELRKEAMLQLEREILAREAVGKKPPATKDAEAAKNSLPALIVFFDNVSSVYDYPAIVQILKKGAQFGIYGVFLTERFEDSPSDCGGVITVSSTGLKFEKTGPEGTAVLDVTTDSASSIDKLQFAKLLSGVNWKTVEDASVPPAQISFFSMFGIRKPAELPLEKWWNGQFEKPYEQLGRLKALIGKFSPTADLVLDLSDKDDAHGPHGFIGGATGSGKSELLKTIILSLAITHHPFDLNFALIDFKGGAAFEELESLPHVVGLMTDIEHNESYATRVIQSLTGEVNSRKRILAQAQSSGSLEKTNIADYELLPVKTPLPRLVIIFDEFAEFKDRHPEESKKLISIARVGRSLGIHLILCTQNPGAAVDNQVKQNSRFRISLNMNSPEDSREIIGIPDAYRLPAGRGYFRIRQPQLFQTAYAGGRYTEGEEDKTQLRGIVDHIIQFNERLKIPTPPNVWEKPLPSRLNLTLLYQNEKIQVSWDGQKWAAGNPRFATIGYYDDPTNQRQPMLQFGGPDQSAHLVIIGAPGAGKSSALAAIALDQAYRYSPEEASIYIIDFGMKNSLKALANLPHTAREGGLISGEEHERIARLFSMLRSEIVHRSSVLRGTNINEFNDKAAKTDKLCSIYLLIDNLSKQVNEALPGFKDQLLEIVSSGQGLGIHVAITAGSWAGIPYEISDLIDAKVSLRQSDDRLYGEIVGPVPKHLTATPVGELKNPGWGLVNTNPVMEVQLAFPVAAETDKEGESNLEEVINTMAKAWSRRRPQDVKVLPTHVYSKELVDNYLQHSNGSERDSLTTPVGLGLDGLDEVTISLAKDGPVILVASTVSGKGKTAFIQTWLLELARSYSKDLVQFVIVDFHSKSYGQFRDLPNVRRFVSTSEQMEEAVKDLEEEVAKRQKKIDAAYAKSPEQFDEYNIVNELGMVLVVIDDMANYRKRGSPKQTELDKLFSIGADCGLRLLAAENIGQLGSTYNSVVPHLSSSNCGILLGGSDGVESFNAKMPYGQKTANLPPGRGYMISNGVVSTFQTMAYWPEGEDAKQHLKQRLDELKPQPETRPRPKKAKVS